MKKIYYLLAITCVMFAACNPMSKTYKDIDSAPLPNSLSVNLISTDYGLLSTTIYANKSFSFNSATDANLYIPTILAAKYPTARDATNANVTFALATSSSSIATPDSTIAHIAIALTAPADYNFPGNTFADFTTATAQSYLAYKYPTPAENQMVLMTYQYFETGVTNATGGDKVTDAFVYLNESWTKLYTLRPAQYAAVNRGSNNYFVAADAPNLVFYFNTILKADPSVMLNIKAGATKYVSYQSTATYQKVLALTYDGSNWAARQTLSYLKLSGTWVPDPTVYITFPDDKNYYNTVTALVSNTVIKAGSLSNLLSFGDFDVKPTDASPWSDSDINIALALVLQAKIANPIVGLPYRVTYYQYGGATPTASKTFLYNGTAFVIQ